MEAVDPCRRSTTVSHPDTRTCMRRVRQSPSGPSRADDANPAHRDGAVGRGVRMPSRHRVVPRPLSQSVRSRRTRLVGPRSRRRLPSAKLVSSGRTTTSPRPSRRTRQQRPSEERHRESRESEAWSTSRCGGLATRDVLAGKAAVGTTLPSPLQALSGRTRLGGTSDIQGAATVPTPPARPGVSTRPHDSLKSHR